MFFKFAKFHSRLDKKRKVAAKIFGWSLFKTDRILTQRALALLPNKILPFRLPDLSIESAERIDTDLVRIKLKGGRCFFGHRSEQKEYLFHHFFQTIIPEEISGDTFKLALDIQRRYFQRAEAIMPPTIMPKGGTFIEGGCYTGLRALRWHDDFDGDCKIIAVEIGRQNFDILRMNIKENKAERSIIPVNAGLYLEDGEMEQLHSFTTRRFLEHTDRWEGHMRYKEMVKTLTIDSLLNQNDVDVADYMNIQVNGAEIEVLKGFKDLDRIKVLGIAAYYSRDGVRNVDVVRDLMLEKGCKVLHETRAGRITLATPKWKDSFEAF